MQVCYGKMLDIVELHVLLVGQLHALGTYLDAPLSCRLPTWLYRIAIPGGVARTVRTCQNQRRIATLTYQLFTNPLRNLVALLSGISGFPTPEADGL